MIDAELSKFESFSMIIHVIWTVCLLASPVPITIYDRTCTQMIVSNRILCGEYIISDLITLAPLQLRVSASHDVVIRIWMPYSLLLGDILPSHMMLKDIARCSTGVLILIMDFVKRDIEINIPIPVIYGKSFDGEEYCSVREVSLIHNHKRKRQNELKLCCFRFSFGGPLDRLVKELSLKANRPIMKGFLMVLMIVILSIIFSNIKLT